MTLLVLTRCACYVTQPFEIRNSKNNVFCEGHLTLKKWNGSLYTIQRLESTIQNKNKQKIPNQQATLGWIGTYIQNEFLSVLCCLCKTCCSSWCSAGSLTVMLQGAVHDVSCTRTSCCFLWGNSVSIVSASISAGRSFKVNFIFLPTC